MTVLARDQEVLELDAWEARPGEVWHVQGPNGAGKTTLLRALSGDTSVRGDLRVCGAVPGTLAARQACLLVPTDADLLTDLTAHEYLHFMTAAWGRAPHAALDLAGRLGVTAFLPRFPEELSRGTRQKVALAAALGLALPLTLLDEPYATLDAASREVLTLAVRERASSGGTVIVTTHGDELRDLHPSVLTLTPPPA
ncbi:ABC transporter ATP-binding protein [Deinococcus aquiradiocola]|uniref:Multidrug ABC transporter ATP-binding protein n=1 Tax=Deinococcus aquiradiocola TaxID=393059 RepID=A0A917PDM2_9DEIO|nr:ATP-binding cassette domain-containing protein [Deinococcus aquiradiocola]GGJ71740.1 multidrug ABC transporter ATP-binding protein [Deinococcus aquiradiocola]